MSRAGPPLHLTEAGRAPRLRHRPALGPTWRAAASVPMNRLGAAAPVRWVPAPRVLSAGSARQAPTTQPAWGTPGRVDRRRRAGASQSARTAVAQERPRQCRGRCQPPKRAGLSGGRCGVWQSYDQRPRLVVGLCVRARELSWQQCREG